MRHFISDLFFALLAAGIPLGFVMSLMILPGVIAA